MNADFEKPNSKENQETLNKMVLLNRNSYLGTISIESGETVALATWKNKATEKEKIELERLTGTPLLALYKSIYVSDEQIKEIENKMERDYGLKSFIEEMWAPEIVRKFEQWKSYYEDPVEMKELIKEKSRPYDERKEELEKKYGTPLDKDELLELEEDTEDYLKRIALTDREIVKLFEFIKKYPERIKVGVRKVKQTDIIKESIRYNFLKDLRDYFNNTLAANRTDELNDLRMDNEGMRFIFSKIQNTLEHKDSNK